MDGNWDDSELINTWNLAVKEYNLNFSLKVKRPADTELYEPAKRIAAKVIPLEKGEATEEGEIDEDELNLLPLLENCECEVSDEIRLMALTMKEAYDCGFEGRELSDSTDLAVAWFNAGKQTRISVTSKK